ncbi:MAG: cyclic nucleotide-binding domain-containing protein, partial [Rhodospirillaceae bacterium]|nr:cyclic nucleotide-binding domain-containing protein [Rhodospirillaceae bacterium]
LAVLPNQAVGVGYLFDLHRSEFGEKYAAPILSAILNIVKPMNTLSDLLPAKSSPEDFAAAVTDLRHRIGADALGPEIGALMAKKFDRILDPNDDDAPAVRVAAPRKPRKKERGSSERVYAPGDIIFQEGDPGDEAFMIVSGKVEISTGSGEERIVMATLGRGEFFGEMALVDDQPRMATATATQEAAVLVVPQEVFKKRLAWLAEEDRMISQVMEVLVTRLRQHGAT